MNNIVISRMTLSDLENISSILQSDFDDFWSEQILKKELQNLSSIYIVAKINSNIVGFAGIWDGIDQAHIMNIAVKKDFRCQNIGSILLTNLIKLAKDLKKPSITLEVKASNNAAIALYNKFNFQILGIRKHYYNNVEDAIIMTLNI